MKKGPWALAWTALAVAALLFHLGAQIRVLDQPFDRSLGGVTSAAYYGQAAKTFAVHGLGRLRLVPMLFCEAGSTRTAFAYPNHPPWPHLLTYPAYRLLGGDEAALRLPILGLILVLAAAFVGLLRREEGSHVATGLAFLLASPMLLEYGLMVDAPMFSLASLLPALWAFENWLDRPSRGRFLIWMLAGLASAGADWFGYFLTIPLAGVILLRREPISSRLRQLAVLALPYLIGIGAWLLWARWALGSERFREALDLFTVPMDATGAAGGGWAGAVGRFALRGYTPMVLALAAIGTVSSLCRRDARGRRILVLLAAGLLPALAFRSRAAVHEFWILQAAPGLAMAAAAGVGAIGRAARRAWVAPLLAAVALALSIRSGLELRASYATDEFETRGQAIDGFASRHDIVFVPLETSPLSFYCEASLVTHVRDMAAFDRILRHLAAGPSSSSRWFFFSPEELGVNPDLAPLLGLMLPGTGIHVSTEGRGAWFEIDREKAYRRIG